MPQQQPSAWNPGTYISRKIKTVEAAVGDIPIVCAVGPGPRAAAIATVLHQALGENARFVFVDTGLTRRGETARTLAYLRNDLGLKIWHADARDFFYSRMRGAVTLAAKAKAADRTLVDSLLRAAADMGVIPALVTDAMPAGENPEHGRAGLFAQFEVTLVDPLRGLTPEQISELSSFLELPAAARLDPGAPLAGAALLIEGEATPAKIRAVREADHVARSFWRARKLGNPPTVKLLEAATNEQNAGLTFGLFLDKDASGPTAAPATAWRGLADAIVRAVPAAARVFLDLSTLSAIQA